MDTAKKNHDERLHRLQQRCEEKGIALNSDEDKFIYKQRTLPYMGHVFTNNGLQSDPNKIKALVGMPQPEDHSGVRRFLCMANFWLNSFRTFQLYVLPCAD